MKTTDLDAMQHHSKEYPMEVGAPKFELEPITEKKDLALRAAKLNAQKEYERIMESVRVLQKQAEELKERLGLSELVHRATYTFDPAAGKPYWLVEDTYANITRLVMLGPKDWSCGPPEYYKYIACIKCLGDNTWEPIHANEE